MTPPTEQATFEQHTLSPKKIQNTHTHIVPKKEKKPVWILEFKPIPSRLPSQETYEEDNHDDDDENCVLENISSFWTVCCGC